MTRSDGMRAMLKACLTALALALVAPVGPAGAQEPSAKQLFGRAKEPAPLEARAIGSYARGCLSGGVALPIDGSSWQVMRLSRNRNWGHPALISYLERLARDVSAEGVWPGLLVGDLAQPRGGPMLTGHASHQIGLDADIWLLPMPDRTLSRTEREEISAVSMLKRGTREIDPAIWNEGRAGLIRRAASYPEVARIFVHPAIKAELCKYRGADRAWLRKVRPWYGHDAHFHVRLSCPAGMAGCANQEPPPAGDGCGADLAWWLGPEPWKPAPTPSKPAPELRVDQLPPACRTVLHAVSGTGAEPAAMPVPRLRP